MKLRPDPRETGLERKGMGGSWGQLFTWKKGSQDRELTSDQQRVGRNYSRDFFQERQARKSLKAGRLL